MLDNAIEAAEKCEPGRRRIALEISGVNGMFLLHMENTSAQKPVVKNGKLRSSKEEEGHGFGMENMRRIVENYGGIFRWEYTEQEFRTEILLEGEEKNEQR